MDTEKAEWRAEFDAECEAEKLPIWTFPNICCHEFHVLETFIYLNSPDVKTFH